MDLFISIVAIVSGYDDCHSLLGSVDQSLRGQKKFFKNPLTNQFFDSRFINIINIAFNLNLRFFSFSVNQLVGPKFKFLLDIGFILSMQPFENVQERSYLIVIHMQYRLKNVLASQAAQFSEYLRLIYKKLSALIQLSNDIKNNKPSATTDEEGLELEPSDS